MELDEQILEAITRKPGISIAQICRTLNDRGVSYCSRKRCYANPRKRAKWGNRKNACKYQLGNVTRKVRGLENQGIIKTRWEKKTDTRQNRGWDFMNGCYLPQDYPLDIPIMNLSEIATDSAKEASK